MKSSRRAISTLAYRHLYSPEGALKQLAEEVLRDVPEAHFIEITAVELEQTKWHSDAHDQLALFPAEDVQASVCEPVLPDEPEQEAHPLKKKHIYRKEAA